MAKPRGDDGELMKAAEAAIGTDGRKQTIALAIRVTKSNSIWAKSGRLNRHMSKPRVLALTSKFCSLLSSNDYGCNL